MIIKKCIVFEKLWSQSDLNGLTYSISIWVENRLDFSSKYFKFSVYLYVLVSDLFFSQLNFVTNTQTTKLHLCDIEIQLKKNRTKCILRKIENVIYQQDFLCQLNQSKTIQFIHLFSFIVLLNLTAYPYPYQFQICKW